MHQNEVVMRTAATPFVLSLLAHFGLYAFVRPAEVAPPTRKPPIEFELRPLVRAPPISAPTATVAPVAGAPREPVGRSPTPPGPRVSERRLAALASHPPNPSSAPAGPPIEGAPPRDAPGAGDGSAGPADSPRASEGESPAPPRIDLFAPNAIGRGAGVDLSAPPPSGFRPRRGVGGLSGRGGISVGDFLAEDAARQRVDKGGVPPRLRDLERRLEKTFDPPFAHVDVANRRELFQKQFVARLRNPPPLRELGRGEDPTRETNQEKMKRVAAQPFFLGRRAEVFVRQKPDGTILEMTLRLASGFHAFDEEAIDAVEKALAGHPPNPDDVRRGEVRTLWRLEATGYVVYSPTPTLVFDEATGKNEWTYPLQKRVDRAVHLVAIY